jgi:hypothetical protein
MEIVVRLDVMLALRKMKARELAAEIGITEQNLSLLAHRQGEGGAFRDAGPDLRGAGLSARRSSGGGGAQS